MFEGLRSMLGETVRRATPTIRIALTVLIVIGLGTGCATKLPRTPDSPTAAVVGERKITLEEVDDTIKDALFERTFAAGDTTRLFEARQAAVDRMVDAEVVGQAAAKSGLEPEVWLGEEVERRYPVGEADIDAFWTEYQHRIPKDRPEDAIRADIHSYLVEERAKQLIVDLRNEARVRMVLASPRYDVQPRGVPRGPEDAPVTIIEFSDFQCPYCLRVTPTIKDLLAKYPEQVRFFYRHLPLDNHSRARSAAVASVCAGRQGEFWDYHDVLFENQGALEDEDLRGYAEHIRLDLDLFDACLVSPEAAAWVDEDRAAADALGISGTPAFYVNGVPIKGAQPLSKFVRLVEDELAAQAGKKPKPAEAATAAPAETDAQADAKAGGNAPAEAAKTAEAPATP